MSKPKILVADADEDFSASFSELLRELGCEVRIAIDADSLLQEIARGAVDLVFIDRQLPGAGALFCTTELWRSRPGTRAVLLTGHSMERESQEMKQHGPFEVLDKPCDFGLVRRIVNSLDPAPVILVVDDDPICADAVASMLSSRGYRVHSAANGQQALEMAAQQPLDLVVLDLCMPVMNGHEVCVELGKSGFTAPVILTTAFPESELMQSESVSAGRFSCLLNKPVESQRLYAAVEGALQGSHRNG